MYSAGGGGNTPARIEKIKAKNEKLHNERQRIREKREEVESKQNERKAKKEARQGKQGKGDANGAAAETETDSASNEHGGMHPARLAMMQKPSPRYHRQRY